MNRIGRQSGEYSVQQVTAVSSQSANSSCSVEDSVEVLKVLLLTLTSLLSGAQRDPLQQVEDVGAPVHLAQHLRLRHRLHYVPGACIASYLTISNIVIIQREIDFPTFFI